MEKYDEPKGRKVAINPIAANVYSFLLLIVSVIVFAGPFYILWKENMVGQNQFKGISLMWLCVLFLVSIVVHELLHGIVFACYAKSGWKSIKFGIKWKYLMPYCHCNEPISKRAYMVALLLPLIAMGIIPSVLSLFIGSVNLLMYGILLISAALGDIYMAWLLRKEETKTRILDHPNEPALYVLYRENK